MWSVWVVTCVFVFFKRKTAYELRISDWSSDVCSSDLCAKRGEGGTSRRLVEGKGRDLWISPPPFASRTVPLPIFDGEELDVSIYFAFAIARRVGGAMVAPQLFRRDHDSFLASSRIRPVGERKLTRLNYSH